jgi:hypothetical protein
MYSPILTSLLRVNLKVYDDIDPALFTESSIGFDVDVFKEKHFI